MKTKHNITRTAEPIKPGYKKTKVGVIPEDWEVKRLGSQVHIDKRNIQSNFDQEYINYVSLSDISNGSITYQKIPFKEAPSRARRVAPKGSILFATVRPNLKNFAIVDRNDIIASTGFAVLESKKADIHFIFNFLYSYFAEKQFNALTVGSNYPALNSSDVKSLKIPIPPLPEQEAIADCLSTWDKGIEKLSALIASKKEQKKGLMQGLFSGKLKVENGQLVKVEDKENWLKGWKEVLLKTISTVTKGKQLNRSELNEADKYPSYSGGITPSGYTDKYNCDANTIIISEGGNSCGYVNFINVDFWLGGHCYSVENNAKKMNKNFLYNILKYNEPKIMRLRVGSGLPNVQKGDLEKFKLKVPSLKEQTEIAEVFNAANKEIELLEQKLESYKTQKKGLMQVLLTGTKRLVES